jgi:putative metalloprotease
MRYTLALSTIALVLSATSPGLAADARSPAVQHIAQAAPSEERLMWGEWSVPRNHRYYTYDTRSAQYTVADVGSLPTRLGRGEFIYDETARVWITHPSGGRNSNYLASYQPAPSRQQIHGRVQSVHPRQLVFTVDDGRVLNVDVSRIPTETQRALAPGDTATMIGVAGRDANHFIAQSIHEDTRGAERLVDGRMSLPRANDYQRYDPATDRYTQVDVASVRTRIDGGDWIYDATARVWVNHPSVGGRNTNYLAASHEGSASPGVTTAVPRPRATVDATQAGRLQRLMLPIVKVMDHPVPANQLKVAITDDPQINAANAGGGQFFVTSGLLQKANDDQLRAILAHELAHQDKNHVAKAQVLGVGLNIGAAILNQIFPGSGALAPLAGELVANKYSRTEEYAADKHGAELLVRAGYSKQMMIDALTWLMQISGSDSGGFFATHPGTGDRIEALRKAP